MQKFKSVVYASKRLCILKLRAEGVILFLAFTL